MPGALYLLASAVLAQAPVNDNFENRTLLHGPLPLSGSAYNYYATAESGELSHYYFGPAHSVWWSWTAERNQRVRISPAGSNFDTVTAVYESSHYPEEIILDSSDATGITIIGQWLTSSVTPGFYGASYLHDDNSDKGAKSVRYTPTIGTAGNYDVYLWWPAYENRAGAVPIDIVYAGGVRTVQVDERFTSGGWVKLTGNGALPFNAGTSGSVRVRTDGTAGVVVADAVRFVAVPRIQDLTRVASADYSLEFDAVAGHTYEIAFDGYYSFSTGLIQFTMVELPAITSATETEATVGQDFSFQVSTNFQANQFYASSLPTGLNCDYSTGLIHGIPTSAPGDYYIYLTAYGVSNSASANLHLKLRTLAPEITSTLQADGTEGDAFTYQVLADKSPTKFNAEGLPAGLTIDTTTGAISGTPKVSGSFSVTLRATNEHGTGEALLDLVILGLVSDNFAERRVLNGTRVTVHATTDGATKEDGEPDHAGDPGGASLWWTWTPPQSGQYRVVIDPGFDPLLSFYEGNAFASLKLVFDNRYNDGSRLSSLIFNAKAGRHYQIAVDAAGGYTGPFDLKIDRIGTDVAKILTITTTPGGTVTPGFLGASYRRLGETLTVTAIPAPGYLFTGWQGGVNSTSPTIKFSMQDAMSLAASFVASPFAAGKGCYYALIQASRGESASSAGLVKLTLDSAGAFTAAIIFGGRSYSVKGAFDVAQALSGTVEFDTVIPRGVEWPLSLSLILDLSNPSEALGGSINDDVVSSLIAGGRSNFNAKTNPAPQAGRYTVLGSPTDNSTPQGSAFGVVIVNASGIVRFTGVLPDGTHVSQSAQLSNSGTWPFYLPLDSAQGILMGQVFLGLEQDPAISGDLMWLKPPKPRDPLYPDGFSGGISFSGGRYAKPIGKNRVLDFGTEDGSGTFYIDLAEVFGSSTNFPVILQTDNTVTADPAAHFSLAIKTSSGLFSGRFTDPNTTRSVPFNGVVVQSQSSGGGLYKVNGVTSSILLQP